ncbi:hypothetical protein LCGC14_0298080 [marine sediment metagenome]|uniref:Uncharacterized protein n=1 Tax=marine sediment metagenome TaxID=412755 RepID=A0A0F9TW62_9ZZZZ
MEDHVGQKLQIANSLLREAIKELEVQNARLQAVLDKLPSLEAILDSMARIQKSIERHISWKKYRQPGGTEGLVHGNLAHHKEALLDYSQVMQTLIFTREAAEKAKGDSQ